MNKRFVYFLIFKHALVLLVGCGNSNSESGDMETSNIEAVETVATETVEAEVQNMETKEINASAPSGEEEYTYIEQTDIFMVDYIDSGDGTQIDWDSMEKVLNRYSLSESVDIYSYFGTYAGYTKPDIEVTESARNSEWVAVGFKEYGFLVKTEDFERVAVAKENAREETASVSIADEVVPVVEDKAASVEAEKEPAAEPPVVETPVVEESTKYTVEETIEIYKNTILAGGINWNPSIKEFASWGTGFIDRSNPEAVAYAELEGMAYGDGAGNSNTQYYFEVTGSDENYVFVTVWACS